MSKRRKHIKAKSVRGGGQVNVTTKSAAMRRARKAVAESDALGDFVASPLKISIYTAVFFAACFLIKWLFFNGVARF